MRSSTIRSYKMIEAPRQARVAEQPTWRFAPKPLASVPPPVLQPPYPFPQHKQKAEEENR